MYKSISLSILLSVVCLSIISYGQYNNTKKQVKPDQRLYECFEKNYLEKLAENNPKQILYLNFFLDNSYFISKIVPGKPVDDQNIYMVPLKKKSRSGKTEYFKEDLSSFDPKVFIVLKYDFNILENKYSHYVLGDTGLVLVFLPRERFNKNFSVYVNSFDIDKIN